MRERTISLITRVCLACALLLAIISVLVLSPGCTATPVQIAHATTIGAGSIAATLVRENERVYSVAVDGLRAAFRADAGTFADYQAASAPLNAEFRRRVFGLRGLSSQLYAAAGIIDASRRGAGPQEYGEAARLVLLALDEIVTMLENGAILPPVPIPPEVNTVRAALRSMLSGGRDGGS